jgi:hypothetical protein
MKLTACLCWYDETVELLEQCVASLAGVVDELVAFDGRWELHPAPKSGEGDIVHSPLHQQFALVEAACNAKIPLVRETARQEAWASQVAKRSALLGCAIDNGADWLFVIDADEWLESAYTTGLRRALMSTGADVGLTDYQMYVDGQRGARYPIRRLYRAASGVDINTAHNGYRTSDGRWLHGDTSHVTLERAEDLSDFITLAEDARARPLTRQMAKREYRRARGVQRVEAWA